MQPADDSQNDSQPLYSILGAILLWCSLLTCGVFLYQWGADTWSLRKAVAKSAIVVFCIGGFATVWALLLAGKNRRPSEKSDLPTQPPSEDE